MPPCITLIASRFGICGFEAELEALALSQTHFCSPTLKIRSQNMTAAQHTAACEAMEAEQTLFHSKLKTNNTPVADDNNSQLVVNVFDSYDDYDSYAWTLFKINTNNGGMYLEGDPADPANVANFVAYEASYAAPDHQVWNLEHEYVHYLDGRFDLYGGFNTSTYPITWWSEGLAEYISHQDDYSAAIDTVADGSTYTLSEIFDTTYANGNSDRIYRWGYLATRFMFEQYNAEVDIIMAATRTGDWQAYKNRIDLWASVYQPAFEQWQQDLVTVESTQPVANPNGPYTAQANSVIQFSSAGSSDPDGTIANYYWYFADGYASSEPDPQHSYSAEGTYNAYLQVTDNEGNNTKEYVTVTVAGVKPAVELQNDTPVSVSGPNWSQHHFKLDVPTGAENLQFNIAGGSGSANLYVRYGTAATTTEFDCRPYLGGNNEVCSIANVQEGSYYAMVRGSGDSFSTTLTASYLQGGSGLADACATQAPVTYGQLQNATPICLGSSDPIWLYVGDVKSQGSIAITTAHGTGDLQVDYRAGGWPYGNADDDGTSNNPGNDECIYITAPTDQYWGYLRVTGAPVGATLVIDFNTSGCR